MKEKVLKKIIYIILMILMLFQTCSFGHQDLTTAYLQSIGRADYHLKYDFGTSTSYVVCSIVGHYIDEIFYPAYCVNSYLSGAETEPYDVAINRIIDDDRIWRILVNSYPYKSAESMGLSEFDAYCVTKMAIYCILDQSELDNFVADDNDPVAVTMLEKLTELVNIGLYGTQTIMSGTLGYNEETELIEDGDYYYKEYSINSNIEISRYYVRDTAGFPNGTYVADVNGNRKFGFDSTENFRVYIPKTSFVNSNVTGYISVTGKTKKYPILYGDSGSPDLQDYVLTSDPYGDDSIVITLNVDTNSGKLVVNKTDDVTSRPIKDVVFGLYKKDGSEVTRAATDENGNIIFENLYPGSYDLKEISTNENYVLNETKFNVDILFNQTTSINVENSKKEGNLIIYKVDKDNNNIRISDVEFELFSNELQKVIGTYKTNANGEINITNLRIGNYKLHEISTNKWYNSIEDVEVVIEPNKTTKKTITNEKKKGQIKIVKIDADNNKIKLEGVKFQVLNDKRQVLETIVTNSNGEATSSKYAIKDYEKLYIKEVETQNNYSLNDKEYEVKIEPDKIKELVVTNEKKKGKIKVVKVDKDNNKIKIKGVTFEIYDKNNNVVDTIVTDSKGEAISKQLPIDEEYTIKETITGNNYVLSDKVETVKLKENEITIKIFENEKKKGQIEVVKIDKDNNEVKLEGVVFEILDENKKVVDTIKTNKEGKATSKKISIDQKYIVREKSTRNEYVLSKENKIVTLKENEIKSIKFENEKKKGQIEVIKIDKDNNEVKLEGVVFEILDENKNVVDTITTNKDGKATSKKLSIDETYTIKEKNTKQEYVLTEETKKITLKENEIKSIIFENEKKKGKIKVVKVDKDNNEVKIEGVTFEIFDKDGSIVDTIVTNKEGTAITKSLPIDNEYLVKEKEAAKEYVLSDEEEKLVLEENDIKTITFENEKKKGNINIFKISDGYSQLLNIEDNTPLAKAKFEVIDEDGTIIGIYETNEKGLVEIKELPYGKYTIYEVESPTGFLKDAEPQTIFIDEDGKVIDVIFKDTPIQPELPKTGDSNELNMFIISVITIVSTLILITKNKNGGIENDRSNKYKN